MRIISGIHKGRKILAPKKLPVRPTTDMAKESLFNILNNKYNLAQLTVLDLFAGTGNISYEFASRGARSVTAIDRDHSCIKFITSTVDQLDMPITPIKSEVFQYLEHCPEQFDLIFADPPYNMDIQYFEDIIALTFEHELLKPGGTLVVEHSKHTVLDKTANHRETRTYGGSAFSFFEKNN